MGTNSGHITNLKQSILETFNIYDQTTESDFENECVNKALRIFFCIGG
jgi:hypothetical protein